MNRAMVWKYYSVFLSLLFFSILATPVTSVFLIPFYTMISCWGSQTGLPTQNNKNATVIRFYCSDNVSSITAFLIMNQTPVLCWALFMKGKCYARNRSRWIYVQSTKETQRRVSRLYSFEKRSILQCSRRSRLNGS